MKVLILAIILNNFLISNCSFADQDGTYQPDAAPQEKNKQSNASFDKRLPPVLPGEVLNDGQGKTKVWSTAGGVSVSAPSSAPQLPSGSQGYSYGNTNIGSVIVDDRGTGKGNH